jgi:hypothetical protein
MANGRRHGNRDTQFEPEHLRVRAIDLDPSAGGLHQGAQPPCCNSDAFGAVFGPVADTPLTMAATDQMPDPNKALAPREPSTHGSSTMASDMTYVPTWTGFLYLAVVLDAFSRRPSGLARTALQASAGPWVPTCAPSSCSMRSTWPWASAGHPG